MKKNKRQSNLCQFTVGGDEKKLFGSIASEIFIPGNVPFYQLHGTWTVDQTKNQTLTEFHRTLLAEPLTEFDNTCSNASGSGARRGWLAGQHPNRRR